MPSKKERPGGGDAGTWDIRSAGEPITPEINHLNSDSQVDELRACWPHVSYKEFRALIRAGVPCGAYLEPFPVGATNVQFDGNRFDLDADGERAFLFVCFLRGELLDLAAWAPRSGKIETLLGRAFCLGDEDDLTNPALYWDDSPGLRIHVDPLSWLRSGRNGIVVLKPEDAYSYIGHCRRIVVESVELQRLVKQWIQPPRLRVEIVVHESAAA